MVACHFILYYHVQIVKCTSCKADRSRASHSADEQSMTLRIYAGLDAHSLGMRSLGESSAISTPVCTDQQCPSVRHVWHVSRGWGTCQLTRGPKFKALYLQKKRFTSVLKSVCQTTHPTPSTWKQKPGVVMHTSTEPEPKQAHLCEFRAARAT